MKAVDDLDKEELFNICQRGVGRHASRQVNLLAVIEGESRCFGGRRRIAEEGLRMYHLDFLSEGCKLSAP